MDFDMSSLCEPVPDSGGGRGSFLITGTDRVQPSSSSCDVPTRMSAHDPHLTGPPGFAVLNPKLLIAVVKAFVLAIPPGLQAFFDHNSSARNHLSMNTSCSGSDVAVQGTDALRCALVELRNSPDDVFSFTQGFGADVVKHRMDYVMGRNEVDGVGATKPDQWFMVRFARFASAFDTAQRVHGHIRTRARTHTLCLCLSNRSRAFLPDPFVFAG